MSLQNDLKKELMSPNDNPRVHLSYLVLQGLAIFPKMYDELTQLRSDPTVSKYSTELAVYSKTVKEVWDRKQPDDPNLNGLVRARVVDMSLRTELIKQRYTANQDFDSYVKAMVAVIRDQNEVLQDVRVLDPSALSLTNNCASDLATHVFYAAERNSVDATYSEERGLFPRFCDEARRSKGTGTERAAKALEEAAAALRVYLSTKYEVNITRAELSMVHYRLNSKYISQLGAQEIVGILKANHSYSKQDLLGDPIENWFFTKSEGRNLEVPK
jgi:hypothetical protein